MPYVGAVCGVVWCRGLLCVRDGVCVVCGLVWCVLCGVVVCGVVWCLLWCGTLKTRVCIQHVPVCAFKTFPCVPATCPHVLYI